MRKIIIFIALLASAIGGLQAQDTVWMKPGPRSNYFNNNWVDTTQMYTLGIYAKGFSPARRFITEDTLQVFGIAAMMLDEQSFLLLGGESPAAIQNHFNHQYPDDPTVNNCEESLLLYQYRGNGSPVMQQLGDSLHVHALDTAPSYYVMSNTAPACFWDSRPKPVYERFFSEPQTVSDTFYAGWTKNELQFIKIQIDDYSDVIQLAAIRPFFRCLNIRASPELSDYANVEAVAYITQVSPDSTRRWVFEGPNENITFGYVIFPILSPKPAIDTTVVNDTTVVIDTTVIDTTHVDTVAIHMPEFMGRYVSVSPNPATGSAEVLSSFGVSRVEVFNAAGRKMMDLKAEGLKATLDVSKLPSGAYLLRIHTPQGVTTKKLVVR